MAKNWLVDVSDGVLPFSKVTDAIVKLNEEGLGEFPNFAAQAKNATGGIGTAIANANTAITRGISNMIQAVGSAGLAQGITNIGIGFEKSLKIATKALTGFINFLKNNEVAMAAFKGTIIGLGIAILFSLTPVLIGAATAIAGMAVAAAPFILAGAAIALVALVIKNNWDKIAPVIDIAKNAFMSLWNTLKPIRDFLANQLTLAWHDFKKVLLTQNLLLALQPLMPVLKNTSYCNWYSITNADTISYCWYSFIRCGDNGYRSRGC